MTFNTHHLRFIIFIFTGMVLRLPIDTFFQRRCDYVIVVITTDLYRL